MSTALTQGTHAATDQDNLFAFVYPELKRIAARQMRAERKSHTLQTTALVHEAYLRLARRLDTSNSALRVQLFALAAQTMKHILVDRARARLAKKRDTSGIYEKEFTGFTVNDHHLMNLHEALERLSVMDPRQAQIVEMRFFGGCSEEEIAEVLGISSRTVKREWSLARTWLYGELCAW